MNFYFSPLRNNRHQICSSILNKILDKIYETRFQTRDKKQYRILTPERKNTNELHATCSPVHCLKSFQYSAGGRNSKIAQLPY